MTKWYKLTPKTDVLRKLFGDKQHYLMDGGDGTGPICTKEQYESFARSTAHLCKEGRVFCLREKIGTKEDLELEPSEAPESWEMASPIDVLRRLSAVLEGGVVQ